VSREAADSPSPFVRRQLLLACADREAWDPLLEALEDEDEECAAQAIWELVDARVEEAVEPMLERMEELDRRREHVWDVLRSGLGRLLGERRESAEAYRALWARVRDAGGLEAVEEPGARPPPAGDGEAALFGRPIDCSRAVFIVDTSGTMETVDPGADGRSRLERAQAAVAGVIRRLPERHAIAVIAFWDGRVDVWASDRVTAAGARSFA